MDTHLMARRRFLQVAAGSWLAAAAPQRPHNIVMIHADDLGNGDLGCYGSKIRTPQPAPMPAK
jgi:hypothetical protein